MLQLLFPTSRSGTNLLPVVVGSVHSATQGSATICLHFGFVAARNGDVFDAVERIAATITGDPSFDGSCRHYCGNVGDWFRSDPRRLRVFGDLGRYVTVTSALAGETDGGVTRTAVIAVASGLVYASPRRVSAICDDLTRMGFTQPCPARADRRERPFRLSRWIGASLAAWLDIMLVAIRPWLAGTPCADPPSLVGFVRRATGGLARGDPFASWSMFGSFWNGSSAIRFMLDLIVTSIPRGDRYVPLVSRKASARAYGVSRRHIGALVDHCLQVGWLCVVDGGLAFSPLGLLRLRLWVAREFAAAKLLIEADV